MLRVGAQQCEKIKHGFARRTLLPVVIATNDFQQLLQCRAIVVAQCQRAGQLQARVEVATVGLDAGLEGFLVGAGATDHQIEPGTQRSRAGEVFGAVFDGIEDCARVVRLAPVDVNFGQIKLHGLIGRIEVLCVSQQ